MKDAERYAVKAGYMLDIPAPEVIQIQIASDGKTVWINTENGCIFRACRIKELNLQDDRFPKGEEETK
jgi:hypothetical protein